MKWALWKWSANEEAMIKVGGFEDDTLAAAVFVAEGGAIQLRERGTIVAWRGLLANPNMPDEVTVPDELPEDWK